jgi:FMN phosphatase YigB (HAD superfamily)
VSSIDIVLFDLGGVLIDLGGVGPMKALASIETDEEMWRRWLSCRWVRTFERGECSADEFAAGVVDDWELAIEPAAFLEAFLVWPGRTFEGADALVAEVKAQVPTGCLSNTNSLHWEHNFVRWPILDAFDYRFLSFELGIVKPDREIFDHIAELLPAPRDRVLFLDDNIINVDGAIEAGFLARHALGVDGARVALTEAGVVG